MKFQDKVFETTEDFRARAGAIASIALASAPELARLAAGRAAQFKSSLASLKVAGQELGKIASVHVSRFVKQNSSLARAAGKDVSDLTRSTCQQFADALQAEKPAPARKPTNRKRKVSTRARKAARAA
jgi:hypothetical protein